MSEIEYQAAFERYMTARDELAAALRKRIGEMVREQYPHAATILVHGEYRDTDSVFIVRLVEVHRGDGVRIASREEADEDVVNAFEDFSDELDPELDFLGRLTGGDYLGEHEIKVLP